MNTLHQNTTKEITNQLSNFINLIFKKMKQKLTLLLLALVTSMGAWAQSPLTSRSEIDVDKLYTISAADSRGNWMYGPADPYFVSSSYKLGYAPATDDTKQQWAFWKKDGNFYLYNIEAECFASPQYSYWWSGDFITLTPYPIEPIEEFGASTNDTYKTDYPAIIKYGNGQKYGVSNGKAHAIFRYQSDSDAGNATRIIEVGSLSDAQKTRANAVAEGALPSASSGSTIYYYDIWNMRQNKRLAYTEDGTQLIQTFDNTGYSAFYFRAVDDGYYIYSATNGLPLKSVSSGSVTFGIDKDDATKYYIISSTQTITPGWGYSLSAKGYCISTSSSISSYSAWNDGGDAVTIYYGSDGGSVWRFSTPRNTSNNVATLRTEAKNLIDNYSTLGATVAAKNALEAVYNEAFSSVAELEAAILTFQNSVSPVFRIKSGHDGYAANSYIYKDARVGSLKWSTSSDIMDFALVKLETTDGLPYTSTTVAAGTYNIIQLYSNGNMFGGTATVESVADTDDQFTITVGGNKKHAQNAGQAIVNWNSSGYNKNGASTWTFEYVDNADNLSKEIARAETRSIYNYINDRNWGTDYGLYASSGYDAATMATVKGSLNISLTNAAACLTSLNSQLEAAGEPTLANQAEMYEYLNEYAAPYIANVSVVSPQAGDFLRIKASATNKSDYSLSDDLYLTSSNYENQVSSSYRAEFAVGGATDNSTIFYYAGSNLTGLANGQQAFMNANNQFQIGDVGAAATIVTFESIGGTEDKAFRVEFNNGGRSLYTQRSASAPYSYYTDAASGDQTGVHYRYFLERVTSLPITMRAGADGAYYATINLPVAVTIPSGLSAYSATADGTVMTLTKVVEDGVLAANQPVILYSKSDFDELAIATTAGTTAGSNELEGTIAAESVTANQNYVLGEHADVVGFYKFGGTTMPGFKAYLPVGKTSNVKAFTFRFEDVEDAIRAIESENSGLEIYDIAGRRVQQAQKGLYIVNGKKVMFK